MKNDELYQNIDNIIFDLGGVVITLDRDRACSALASLGVDDAWTLLGLYRQEEPFLGLETGRITAAEFYDLIRSRCEGVTDTAIQDAFNEFLVEIPVERLEMLRKVREAGFKTYVLSNTNPVMFNSWIAKAFRKEGLTINDYFDGIVTSFAEGTCKPDIAIFETVLRRYDLPGDRTIMLDDSEANCKAAVQAGMRVQQVGKEDSDNMIALCDALIENRKEKL